MELEKYLTVGAFGVAISAFGAVALWCSSNTASALLKEHKYIKLSSVNMAIPGLFLIVFGALIATLPLTLPLLAKKETLASINVTMQTGVKETTAPRKTFKDSVSLLVPVDKDMKPAPIALSLLVDTAKSFASAKQSPKVIIASYGFVLDATGKKGADKAAQYVVELLANNGITTCDIDHKTAVKVEQAGTGLCVTVQGGK